jgi:hypothetical protein
MPTASDGPSRARLSFLEMPAPASRGDGKPCWVIHSGLIFELIAKNWLGGSDAAATIAMIATKLEELAVLHHAGVGFACEQPRRRPAGDERMESGVAPRDVDEAEREDLSRERSVRWRTVTAGASTRAHPNDADREQQHHPSLTNV